MTRLRNKANANHGVRYQRPVSPWRAQEAGTGPSEGALQMLNTVHTEIRCDGSRPRPRGADPVVDDGYGCRKEHDMDPAICWMVLNITLAGS